MCLNVTNGKYDGHGMSLVAKCLQSSYCHGGVVSFISYGRQLHIVFTCAKSPVRMRKTYMSMYYESCLIG